MDHNIIHDLLNFYDTLKEELERLPVEQRVAHGLKAVGEFNRLHPDIRADWTMGVLTHIRKGCRCG